MMQVRKSVNEDLPSIMEIFAIARDFMAAQGNPNQWGPRKWPPQSLIEEDIAASKSYVIEEHGVIYGTFFFDYGVEVDPCYLEVKGGSWTYSGPYGVIHRIASSQEKRGIGQLAIDYASTFVAHLRLDTHEDNAPMQKMLLKMGFREVGIIYVGPNEPRIAFER